MPHRPWRPPSSHGRHGASLPAPPHATISQHYGRLLYAAAPGVGHHGGHCQQFTSRRVNRRCGVVGGCVLRRNTQGGVPDTRQCLPSEVRKSIPVSIRAVVSAASMPNRLLLHVCRLETSWRHDASWRFRRKRRNRSRRRGFLLDVISCIHQSWWPLWSYGRHEGLLPAFDHTTISKHTRQQVSIIMLDIDRWLLDNGCI